MQPTQFGLPETAFSLFTASQILFSARVVIDHMLCNRRVRKRRADIYNGKRVTTIRTIYGSRRGKENRELCEPFKQNVESPRKRALTTCFTIDKVGARGKFGHESAKDEMPWSTNG